MGPISPPAQALAENARMCCAKIWYNRALGKINPSQQSGETTGRGRVAFLQSINPKSGARFSDQLMDKNRGSLKSYQTCNNNVLNMNKGSQAFSPRRLSMDVHQVLFHARASLLDCRVGDYHEGSKAALCYILPSHGSERSLCVGGIIPHFRAGRAKVSHNETFARSILKCDIIPIIQGVF